MFERRHAPGETITVWSGEWPYVKRGVSEVRATVEAAARGVSRLFDIPGYLAVAKKYSDRADQFVTSQTLKAGEQLHRHAWLVPASSITLTSLFVVSKSVPWGGWAMFRNGTVAAMALSLFLFPRELAAYANEALPYSTSSLLYSKTKGTPPP